MATSARAAQEHRDGHSTSRRQLQLAQQPIADEGGFASLSVLDHFFQLDQWLDEAEPMLEGYTTLGYLAAITERVQLAAVGIESVSIMPVGPNPVALSEQLASNVVPRLSEL